MNPHLSMNLKPLTALLAAALLLPYTLSAQVCITPQFRLGFDGEAHDPVRAVPLASADGSLYFTTNSGGWANDGALIKVAADGTRTVLVHCDRVNSERSPKVEPIGFLPETGVIEGPDGALYGTTQQGGNSTIGVSTVFRCTKAGVWTTLGYLAGGSSVTPSRLTLASDGNFYGVTTYGGTGYGTIFKVVPNTPGNYTSCTVSTIAQFTGNAATISALEGSYPRGPLVERTDGSKPYLYGVLGESGAVPTTGRVFRFALPTTSGAITPSNVGRLTAIGSLPEAGLTKAPDGTLYGTVSRSASGGGAVYVVTPSLGMEAIYDFGSFGEDLGSSPNTPLLIGSDEFLYGTNNRNAGTVWRMALNGESPSLLHAFSGGTGGDGDDATGLAQRADGSLWGLTVAGGSDNRGTLFSITGIGRDWSHSVAWHMGLRPAASDGSHPSGGLVSDGSLLYGTTETGGSLVNNGSGYGTIYSYNPVTNVKTTLFSFTGTLGALGHWPRATLLRRADGWFYGTTVAGGQAPFPGGTVFRWRPASGATPQQFATLAQFNTTAASGAFLPGARPEGALCDFGDGWLYGTTREGGTDNRGTLYRIHTTPGTIQSIFSFTGTGGARPGGEPVASLTKHGSLLWGVTTGGGAGTGNLGSLFSYDPASGNFTSRFDFTTTGINSIFGYSPSGTLLVHNGLLYGTCKFGGAGGGGAVWTWNPTTSNMSLVRAFTNAGALRPPAYPLAGLAVGADGALYGTASESFPNGQPGNYGNLYRIGKDGSFSITGIFTGFPAPLTPSLPGANPQHNALCMGPDGMLYGTTPNGATGYGGIFRINPGPLVTTRTPRALTANSVSAGGFVTPNGVSVSRSVEYLTTAALSRGEAPATISVFSLPVSSPGGYAVTITGLTPNIDYAFRAVASSAECGDSRGEWVVFRITSRAIWLNEKFGANALNDSIGGLNADPDGDGKSNLLEWAMNTDPLRADTAIDVIPQPLPASMIYRDTHGIFGVGRALQGDEFLQWENSHDLSWWYGIGDPFIASERSSPAAYNLYARQNMPAARLFLRMRSGITGTERIPTLYNTGVNDAGQVVPDNYVDLHWDAGAFIGGAWQEYGFAYHRTSQYGYPIAPAGPWMGDNGKSGWLGYSPTFAGGTGNTYVYRTKFNVPYGIDPRTVAISGRITSDDSMYHMALNGFPNLTGITGDGNHTGLGPEWFITRGFQTGDNTLEFHVEDLGAPSGFRAELSGTWQRAGRVALPDLMNSGCLSLDATPISTSGQTVSGMKVLFPGSTTPVTPVAGTSAGGWPIAPGAWFPETSSSTWIKPDNNASHAAGTYTYIREFDLTGFDPYTVEIEGRVAADDTVEIWFNFRDFITVSGVNFGGWSSFKMPPRMRSLLTQGVNRIEFRVTNNPFAGTNPSGLRYEFLHAAALPLQ